MKQKGSGGIFRGTLLLSVSTLLIKVLGVIYKIPLASYLGDEGMGYFNSAYTVYAFFYLVCTAGVPKAVASAIREEGEIDLFTSLAATKETEAAEKIRAIDLNTLTPIEAMNLLFEVKKILG